MWPHLTRLAIGTLRRLVTDHGQDNAVHMGLIWGWEKRPLQHPHNPPTRRVARARATTSVASHHTCNPNLFFARAGGGRSHHHDAQHPSPSVVRLHVAPHDPASSGDDRPSGHSCFVSRPGP